MRTRPRRSSAHALACTMIFLVLAMLLWTVTFRQMGSWLRTEKAQIVRSQREIRSAKAMAWALTLLETGAPPQDSYACRVQVEPDQFYVLLFEPQDATHRDITVRPADPADLLLPLAPANFVPANNSNGSGSGNGTGWNGWWQNWLDNWRNHH